MRFGAFLPWLAAVVPFVAASLQKGNPPPSERVPPSVVGLADDIWRLLQNGANCVACQGILERLRAIADIGDEAFVGAMQVLCVLSGIQDPEVCHGVIRLEGPTIANVIRNMEIPSYTSLTFCSTILGLCEATRVKTPYLEFPPLRKNPGRQVPSREKPLKIVHFSDIHVDRQYTVGSNTQCKMPICCRQVHSLEQSIDNETFSPNSCDSVYTGEDAPGTTKNPAGLFGDHKCDTPVDLEASMYNAINELVPDVEFAIFTGDIVDHTLWNTTQLSNTRNIKQAMKIMDKNLKRVYATIGNHEMSPANLFARKNEQPDAGWLYRLLNYHWKKWMDAEAVKDMKEGGCYATKHPNSRLRIISINTNMYYRKNFNLYRHPMGRDPNSQLKWLAKQLDFAERANDRAIIIGHMPMGDFDALPEYSNTFDTIVNRYADTISALFFGHTHVDHFEIHYSDYEVRTEAGARAVSYIAPSLTPTSGMPSFRVYEVDPVSYAVLDSVQYTADMNDPEYQTKGPVWKKYYSAREVYGAATDPPLAEGAELSPAFWHNVTELFERNTTVFHEYLARKSRGWKEIQACGGACRDNEICQLRGARSENNCWKPHFGINLGGKRSLAGNGQHEDHAHDDCGASVSGTLLAHLATNKDLLTKLQEMSHQVCVDGRNFRARA